MRDFFNGYVIAIPENFKKTFNCDIDKLISIANSGPDPCWL